MSNFEFHHLASAVFVLALVHTFCTGWFERLAHRWPAHAGLLHWLGEVEVVFGFWAAVLLALMVVWIDADAAIAYAESRNYTEPLFVFAIMVVAASRPILQLVQDSVSMLARRLPLPDALARVWLCLSLVPLAGSLITEPAAMTLAALMLVPVFQAPSLPQRWKYLLLGTLLVNVSVGGTLTAFAAPPVLMVAKPWGWDNAFMLAQFGWKATLAVLINATLLVWGLRAHLTETEPPPMSDAPVLRAPAWMVGVHLLALSAVIATAHHPVVFLGVLLLFMGFVQAYAPYQSPLILRQAALVGFFLAGLVILGGLQSWWLQPLLTGRAPEELFAGALVLTAFTDNAALTYLGSLIDGLSPQAQYMLVAGAVAGGGLTVIANAPNPAGVALVREGFADQAVGAGALALAATVPTLVAGACFVWL